MNMQITNFARGGIMVVLTVVMAAAMIGCQQPLKPGETGHKVAVAWPIFDSEKWTGVDEKGREWEKAKGDACFFLVGWEKTRKWDKEDNVVYRKDRSTVVPFCFVETEETETYVKSSGLIMFYPSNSCTSKKGPACVPPPAEPKK